MGWSDRGPTPRDANQQVRELHALLAGARIEEPYVLVGHSYGARIARVYAKQYSREVVGMVLSILGRWMMIRGFRKSAAMNLGKKSVPLR
jgi:alpha-beta hydrolase superfamily lysophospholipase